MSERRDVRLPPKPMDRSATAEPRQKATAPTRRAARRDAALLYAGVAGGSVLGSSLRHVAAVVLHQELGSGFPWATLFVNLTGSLLIGLYAALTGPDGRLFAGPRQRHFVMTGFCGGYTTFSAFSLDTLRLALDGNATGAGLNIAASVFGSLVAVWVGYALATLFNRLRR
jgi:fluoride exporter